MAPGRTGCRGGRYCVRNWGAIPSCRQGGLLGLTGPQGAPVTPSLAALARSRGAVPSALTASLVTPGKTSPIATSARPFVRSYRILPRHRSFPARVRRAEQLGPSPIDGRGLGDVASSGLGSPLPGELLRRPGHSFVGPGRRLSYVHAGHGVVTSFPTSDQARDGRRVSGGPRCSDRQFPDRASRQDLEPRSFSARPHDPLDVVPLSHQQFQVAPAPEVLLTADPEDSEPVCSE
jgi:hypothetical protein